MDAMLMGLVITQVIQWRSQAKNDSFGLKTIVYSASVLGLCETGFIFAMVTHLFVYNFGVWVNFASITCKYDCGRFSCFRADVRGSCTCRSSTTLL